MDELTIEVLNVFEHFEYKSEFNQSTNGLYEIKMNEDKAIIFRNGDSWGVLSHWLGEPVTKCVGFMRNDRIEMVKMLLMNIWKRVNNKMDRVFYSKNEGNR